jgi:hypothetical protein
MAEGKIGVLDGEAGKDSMEEDVIDVDFDNMCGFPPSNSTNIEDSGGEVVPPVQSK